MSRNVVTMDGKEMPITSIYELQAEELRKDLRKVVAMLEECKRTGKPPDITFTPGCGCKWVNSKRHETCDKHAHDEVPA